MFTSPIKSRPQYRGLRAVASARRHLVSVEGEGVKALRALFDGAPAGFSERAEILYAVPGEDPQEYRAALEALRPRSCEVFATGDDVLGALDRLLATALMSTRLYAAGTEGFIGRVVKLAVEHGVDHRSVLTEHSGSLARRVQCVHCKGFTENVTTSIFECGHCGTLLFVRDHYSRRLAAFQGVSVNAEEPGSRPVGQEVYR